MQSLWMDPEERHFPVLEGDLSVDVAIIGAGFSGLGAAYALRHSGLAVAVLEGRSVASGASGRNAGFLLAGPAMSFDSACKQVGADMATQVWRFTTQNMALLATIIEERDIECGYLRRGSMSLAATPEEWQEMQHCVVALQAAGIAVCGCERASLPRPFDRRYFGGLYYAGNGELNPGTFLLTLAKELAPRVGIFEQTSVHSLNHDSTWHLGASKGRVDAEWVIVATNAYTNTLIPSVPISATRGQVLSTAPLNKVVVPFPMYANHGYQYWRQTEEGRVVVGGWRDLDMAGEVGTVESLHPDIQPVLEAFATDVVGSQPHIEHRWAGIMGFTPDGFPLVGAVPDQPNLWIAAGYSGHGVSMAFSCGAAAAESLTARTGQRRADVSKTTLPASFDPARLGSTPQAAWSCQTV